MEGEGSGLSKQVQCARCLRDARDAGDLADWQPLDEGVVCPGCLTMLEAQAPRAVE
jgi:hypothetical protein